MSTSDFERDLKLRSLAHEQHAHEEETWVMYTVYDPVHSHVTQYTQYTVRYKCVWVLRITTKQQGLKTHQSKIWTFWTFPTSEFPLEVPNSPTGCTLTTRAAIQVLPGIRSHRTREDDSSQVLWPRMAYEYLDLLELQSDDCIPWACWRRCPETSMWQGPMDFNTWRIRDGGVYLRQTIPDHPLFPNPIMSLNTHHQIQKQGLQWISFSAVSNAFPVLMASPGKVIHQQTQPMIFHLRCCHPHLPPLALQKNIRVSVKTVVSAIWCDHLPKSWWWTEWRSARTVIRVMCTV